MIANLLFVSADDFPLDITRILEKNGFSCYFSRGVMKTREILKKQHIDAIIWLFWGHERALAGDLLAVFNRHGKIPIVFITRSYNELDFAEDIKGLFANVDLNDEVEDIIKTIETACNQSIIVEQENPANDTHEIDFKNVVSQIIKKPVSTEIKIQNQESNPLKQIDVWDAVDKNEKRILSENVREKPKNIIPKVKNLFGKS